ncbi:MAG: hypothetical protein ACFFE6_03205 [Candidatus Thorarchaeota archaeon]
MSNYQRNTSMVVCIFAVLIIGAVVVGALSYYGTTNWNWNPVTTDYAFEAEVGATTGTVMLDVDLAAGAVVVTFVDNATLLYDVDIRVDNTTLDRDGAPTVTFTSNVIRLDYTAAGVNVTLGSGLNYTIDIVASAGDADIILDEGAHVGDISVQVTAGEINFVMSDAVVLLGSPSFDLESTTGGIFIVVDLPPDVGGSIECATTVGGVDITAAGWTEITSNHYETTDYGTASQSITILAQTDVGEIDAVLT